MRGEERERKRGRGAPCRYQQEKGQRLSEKPWANVVFCALDLNFSVVFDK